MRTGRLVRGVVISLAAFGICVPPVAFAAEPSPTPVVTDVALKDGGVLHGQVVDLQGAGVAGVPVSVKTQNREIASATTATEGRFSVPGLKGGVYHVAAAEGHGVYRLWTAGTAPPSAQNGVIVYTQDCCEHSAVEDVLRQSYCDRRLGGNRHCRTDRTEQQPPGQPVSVGRISGLGIVMLAIAAAVPVGAAVAAAVVPPKTWDGSATVIPTRTVWKQRRLSATSSHSASERGHAALACSGPPFQVDRLAMLGVFVIECVQDQRGAVGPQSRRDKAARLGLIEEPSDGRQVHQVQIFVSAQSSSSACGRRSTLSPASAAPTPRKTLRCPPAPTVWRLGRDCDGREPMPAYRPGHRATLASHVKLGLTQRAGRNVGLVQRIQQEPVGVPRFQHGNELAGHVRRRRRQQISRRERPPEILPMVVIAQGKVHRQTGLCATARSVCRAWRNRRAGRE